MNDKVCVDCGAPGEFALLDEAGAMHGWLCEQCEQRRRRRRLGWRRRLKRRLHQHFGW